MMIDTLSNNLHAISSKLDLLTSKVDKISNTSIWTPIIVALISAVIGTLLAQLIDRISKNKNEKEKDLREIKSKCINALIVLKDLFRQLALHKFHAQYWWHIHFKETDKEYRDRYYLEHLRAQSEARETEKQIAVTKAAFLAEVVKYEKLAGKKFNVDLEKELIGGIVFRKANEYPSELDADKLRNEIAKNDEMELRNDYFKNLNGFERITLKMI